MRFALNKPPLDIYTNYFDYRSAGRERSSVRWRRISSTSARRIYTASNGIVMAATNPHTISACHSHCQMSRMRFQG